jgi:hypothetical protein
VPTVAFGGELKASPPTEETTMVSGPVMVKAGLLESVALTVKVDVPATVGVPLTTQLVDKVRPAGSAPAVSRQV